MAERRMFTKKITDDDNFTSLSASAQALYFHLNTCADDDGFNNQVSIAMFKAHASVDDLKVLLAKNYIIRFESGVIVIKHWRMHNTIRKDRYTPTSWQEEIKQLGIKDNGSYTLGLPTGCQVVAERLPQDSIGKDSIVEESIVEVKQPQKRFKKPTLEEVQAYCLERNNNVDPEQWYNHYETVGWKVGRNPMKDWKASVRTWERNRNNGKPKPKPTIDYDQFTE